MIELKRSRRLKKELSLLHVYAIATGTTLSAGLFLLPGLAAVEAGPAIVLAYVLAAVPLIPAMLSIVELATAMPRAGGVYYFLDRALGPMVGTIGGMGTWLALVLKVAFALIGMGAYIALFVSGVSITPVAIGLAIALGILNIYSAKKTGRFQLFLVVFLLSVLAWFIFNGLQEINPVHFTGFFDPGASAILSTAGLVYISYVGVTKIASLSEEIENPERNIPLGVFLALATALVIYGVGTVIMVGVLPMEVLRGDLTPVATTAKAILGEPGFILVSIAALVAFVSVANAGIMSASRYPLAMSRDHILPRFFHRLGKSGTPVSSILFTLGTIIAILLLLDPTGIAKLASAFQLLVFAFVCLAVIVMRESRIESYDPGFRSPLYPWTQITGIIAPLVLIAEMGALSIAFSAGILLAGAGWYWYYARGSVMRTGAIYHIFERLGQLRYSGLDRELRGILKEKGLREDDPYDEIVAKSYVIDLDKPTEFEDVVELASEWFAQFIPYSAKELKTQFLEGTRIGVTPVTHGIALPHLRIEGLEQSEMILVRCRPGIHIVYNNPLTPDDEDEAVVKAVFFLISPEDNPTLHLRILAQIAGRVDDENFMHEWEQAADDQELKEVLLHDERFLSLFVKKGTASETLIGKPLRELRIPDTCLIALLRRGGQTIVPKGDTVFQEGDKLTIIGDLKGMNEMKKRYGGG